MQYAYVVVLLINSMNI